MSDEGNEDMMLMKGGDSSNFMQLSKESDDKKKKTKKVRLSRSYSDMRFALASYSHIQSV